MTKQQPVLIYIGDDSSSSDDNLSATDDNLLNKHSEPVVQLHDTNQDKNNDVSTITVGMQLSLLDSNLKQMRMEVEVRYLFK